MTGELAEDPNNALDVMPVKSTINAASPERLAQDKTKNAALNTLFLERPHQ